MSPTLPPWFENPVFWFYLMAWAPFAVFVVLYATRSKWRSTGPGRAAMTLAGALTAVLTFVLIVLIFPIPDQAKQVLRALDFGAVTLAGWVMVRTLWVEQRRGADHEEVR